MMSLHGGTRLDRKHAARAVIFDRRLLISCIIAAVLALLTWSIALATEYWIVTSCPGGVTLLASGVPGLQSVELMTSHAGLWRTCRQLLSHADSAPDQAHVITACRYHDVATIPELPDDHPVNVVIEYRRTCLAFSVLSVLLTLLAVFFSWYTLRVPRYTFKRVSASLYFIAAGVMLVVVEVQNMSANYERQKTPTAHPVGCHWNYSFSFILSWVCFIVLVACGLGFLFTSGKKKRRVDGQEALTGGGDGDDEPHIMGR